MYYSSLADTEEAFQDIEKAEANNEVVLTEPTEPISGPSTEKTEKVNVKEYFLNNNLTTKKEIKWRTNLQYITPEFQWYKQEKLPCVDLESPYQFFCKYFTDGLFERMATFTNLYAVQKQIRFSCTNSEEMKTFVGIHVLMGNLHYPRIKCYWNPKLRISHIADNMPLNRFYTLRQNLHFVDITNNAENRDRFWKIRPLYDTIRSQMLTLPLESKLSIDEQMVPFKGSLNVKQFIKNKPKPWGIKIYALCGTSGQMLDFILYQGSTTGLDHSHSSVFGQSGAVVLKLSERIREKNCQLYFDNYFSNYNVLQVLRNNYIYATCTARLNRFNNPLFSSDKEMKRRGRGSSEEVISQDGEVIMTKWFDNKPVVMASNYMGIGNMDQCKRWDKTAKQFIQVNRP